MNSTLSQAKELFLRITVNNLLHVINISCFVSHEIITGYSFNIKILRNKSDLSRNRKEKSCNFSRYTLKKQDLK